MHELFELTIYFVMGCSLGCAAADVEHGNWFDAVVGGVAAMICVVALVG